MMIDKRRLGYMAWLAAVGLGISACEPEEFHPGDEHEERGTPVAPSEELRDEVREQERREALSEDVEGR
jgi:hypothetical protein